MWNFLKKLTGKKEEAPAKPAPEVEILEKARGSVGEILRQARRNPAVMKTLRALMERMQKEGVDVGDAEAVRAWTAKNKDKLMEEAKANEVPRVQTFVRAGPRIGRNDPCHCGSGKKYKKCHGITP